MYNEFFGLREDAFGLTPDPRFLFLSWKQRKALAGLTYAVLNRKRFILLTGDIGTGKTTLVATARAYIPADRAQFSVIYHPTMKAAEIVESALLGFGAPATGGSKAQLVGSLQQVVESALSRGQVSALVIDDAQQLPPDALEEVRLLGNLDALQIVLTGQNELSRALNRENMAALKERIAVHLTTEPLLPEEVRRYIAHRWKKAGGLQPPPFDGDAQEAITRFSRGVPRRINVLCDNALMAAFTEQALPASEKHVLEAAKSLNLADSSGQPRPSRMHGDVQYEQGVASLLQR
jgi:general secretion pathway protein A